MEATGDVTAVLNLVISAMVLGLLMKQKNERMPRRKPLVPSQDPERKPVAMDDRRAYKKEIEESID